MANVLEDFLDQFRAPSTDRYRLAAALEGHNGPINAFAFNAQGTLLASGGDDEEVRLWDVNRYSRFQTLADESRQWGQVTSLKFINFEGPATATEWLCFGTGRGLFLIYRRPRKAGFIQHSSKRIFTPGDSVESFEVDLTSQRIVVSSHNGNIKLCSFIDGQLTEIWNTELLDAIPRSVRFGDKGKMVFIYGMETGTLICRDSETSAEIFTRSLPTPIGNVSVCPSTGNIAIDNMKSGFDLYAPNRTNVARTFVVESTKTFVKKSAFGEMGKVLVCGSDHGVIYVYSCSNETEPLQILRHGSRFQMIQTVETTSTHDEHIIASGTSSGKHTINIWKKKTQRGRNQSEQTDTTQLLANLFLLVFVAYLTFDKWYSFIEEHYESVTAYIPNNAPVYMKSLILKWSEPAPTHDLDLGEVLCNLDDAALRKLLGINGRRDRSLTITEDFMPAEETSSTS